MGEQKRDTVKKKTELVYQQICSLEVGVLLWMFFDVLLGCLELSFPLHHLNSCFHSDGVRIYVLLRLPSVQLIWPKWLGVQRTH